MLAIHGTANSEFTLTPSSLYTPHDTNNQNTAEYEFYAEQKPIIKAC